MFELSLIIYEKTPLNFLTNPIRVDIISIPLSGSDFHSNSLFVYEASKDFPHVLANTKQTKDKLLKLIELLS